ncbi:MAG: hypothetical protein Ct9H90mV1_0390 [Prasinovirus sp.]|nr:MAG: hypothetical protein Ct9H90mV1_0390 [Prasinovirus sp.]|tara:strand:+ start:481 stop:909 length:429 start_codon:yes stop_codon:yes gene_type:complete
MAAASKKDLFLMILLWNAVLTLSSVPLLSQDPWVNMTWITLILPNILGFMPRGGPLWGRMALDAPFMLLATAIAFITSFIASKIKASIKNDFKNYGKTTRSTGNVLALRAGGLLAGFLISYLILGEDSVYSHFNNGNMEVSA